MEEKTTTPEPTVESAPAAVSAPARPAVHPNRGGFGGTATGYVPSEAEKAEMERIAAIVDGRA